MQITYDFEGWAFYRMALALKKYVYPDAELNRYENVTPNFPILQLGHKTNPYYPDQTVVLVCSHSDSYNIDAKSVWAYSYDVIKSLANSGISAEYMPPSIDEELFPLQKTQPEEFTIGWAGNQHRPCKRYHIFSKIRKQMNDVKFVEALQHNRHPQIPNEQMAEEFYHKCSLLLITSDVDCGPGVAYEAALCGVPVMIVGNPTRVGFTNYLSTDSWFCADDNSSVDFIRKIMKDNALLKKVGLNSRQEILDKYTFKVNLQKWKEIVG